MERDDGDNEKPSVRGFDTIGALLFTSSREYLRDPPGTNGLSSALPFPSQPFLSQ